MNRWQNLAALVAERSPAASSHVHGLGHWRRVRDTGLEMAGATGVDGRVVELFALLHDAARRNDGHDPFHGARGAALALELRPRLGLADDQLDLLVIACTRHADGDVSDDPTIGVCWDADRLDLGRVGIVPSPELLSTATARRVLASRNRPALTRSEAHASGWRVWLIRDVDGTVRLRSPYSGAYGDERPIWAPGERFVAGCPDHTRPPAHGCTCGVYVARRRAGIPITNDFRGYLQRSDVGIAVGRVRLDGPILTDTNSHAWLRGSAATIERLDVLYAVPERGRTVHTLAAALRREYGVPVAVDKTWAFTAATAGFEGGR